MVKCSTLLFVTTTLGGFTSNLVLADSTQSKTGFLSSTRSILERSSTAVNGTSEQWMRSTHPDGVTSTLPWIRTVYVTLTSTLTITTYASLDHCVCTYTGGSDQTNLVSSTAVDGKTSSQSFAIGISSVSGAANTADQGSVENPATGAVVSNIDCSEIPSNAIVLSQQGLIVAGQSQTVIVYAYPTITVSYSSSYRYVDFTVYLLGGKTQTITSTSTEIVPMTVTKTITSTITATANVQILPTVVSRSTLIASVLYANSSSGYLPSLLATSTAIAMDNLGTTAASALSSGIESAGLDSIDKTVLTSIATTSNQPSISMVLDLQSNQESVMTTTSSVTVAIYTDTKSLQATTTDKDTPQAIINTSYSYRALSSSFSSSTLILSSNVYSSMSAGMDSSFGSATGSSVSIATREQSQASSSVTEITSVSSSRTNFDVATITVDDLSMESGESVMSVSSAYFGPTSTVIFTAYEPESTSSFWQLTESSVTASSSARPTTAETTLYSASVSMVVVISSMNTPLLKSTSSEINLYTPASSAAATTTLLLERTSSEVTTFEPASSTSLSIIASVSSFSPFSSSSTVPDPPLSTTDATSSSIIEDSATLTTSSIVLVSIPSQVIVNGGFEDGGTTAASHLVPWVNVPQYATSPQPNYPGQSPTAQSGSWAGYFYNDPYSSNHPIAIQQTLTGLRPGLPYILQYAVNPSGYSSTVCSFTTSIDGVQYDSILGTTPPGYQTRSAAFFPSSNTAVLSFAMLCTQSFKSWYVYIDDVSLIG